jgi:hypothetical protein
MSATIPPDTRQTGQGNPAADMDDVADVLARVTNSPPGSALPPGYFARQAAGDGAQRIVVPLYEYPTYYLANGDYQTIQAAGPVASIVILNADNGPGTYTDDWTAQISELHAAGIYALGYVPTGYGDDVLATVESMVDTWYSYYPALDGIFYDEGAYLIASQPYYLSLYNYVKAKNTGECIVLLNCGDIPDQSYMSTCDILCTCEETYTYYTTEYAASQPDWLPYYAASRYFHIIEEVATLAQLGEVLALSRTFRAGYVYVIDSLGGYTTLAGNATSNPLFWSHQVAWCRSGFAPGPAATATLTTGAAITWNYQYDSYPLTAAGAVTGLILSAPSLTAAPPALTAPQSASIRVTLINTSAYSMTFAAAGTSNVADGTSDVIAAGTAVTYIWEPAASLWYRVA